VLTTLLEVLVVLWVLRAVNVALFCALVPRLAPAERRPQGGLFVSVIVPARDEERDIGPATESKLSQDDPGFEVVVVDDQSCDRTREILRGLEVRFPERLRVVEGAEPPPGWLGKPHALHEGAAAARATRPDDWLLFSDADVHYAPDLLARALSHAESRGLDFLTLFPRMEMKGFGEWLMAPAVGNTFAVYVPGWLVNIPAVKSIGAGGGVFNLVRRRAYDAIGGHEAQKASVVDDILLGLRAKRAGFRCGFALALDSVSVRMYHGFFETLRGFAKNLYFGLGGTLVIAIPALLVTLLDGLLPSAVLFGGVAGFGPGPGSRTFALALAAVLLTIGVRAAAHRRLGYPVTSILFHPAFVLAISVMAARSTWENGVLGRHVWRGRETDARTLRF
jgi:glycosyltransferase involved in cell wall biosynthesis